MSVDPSKLAAKSSSTALTQLAPLSASKLTLPLPQSESNGTKTRPKTSRSMSTTNVKAPSVAALPPLSVSSLPSPTMPRRTKSFLSVTENTGSEKAPAGSLLPSTPRSPRNCSASPKTPRKTLVKQTSAPRGISETENDNTTSQQNLQKGSNLTTRDVKTDSILYPLTPHQRALYSKIMALEAINFAKKLLDPSLCIIQCHRILNPVIVEEYFLNCVRKVATTYPCFRLRLVENDSNSVQLDASPSVDTFSYKLYDSTEQDDKLFSDKTDEFLDSIWKTQLDKCQPPQVFHVIIKKCLDISMVYFAFSAVLMDQLSATFISNEIIRLYTNGVTKVDWDTLPLENYESKEVTPFPEFARAYASDANAVDNNNEAAAFPLFWSQIFVDGTDPPLSFEKYDRISFEKQRTLFLSDLEKQASEISALETRKKTQDSQLMFLRKQRLDIDSYSPQVETVLDPVTKQEIQITKAAKAAILFEIFGEEDVAVDENVEGLLKRHEISAEVQSKLGGTTIGDVSAIDNDSLIAIGLLGKDRRKLLALSEMLKSKVSEGLFAQDKVKSSIERKIMRLQRESDDLGEKLRTQIAAHTALKKEIEIRSRTVKQTWSNNKQTPSPVLGLSLKNDNPLDSGRDIWGYTQFEIDKQVANKIKTLCLELEKTRFDQTGKDKTETYTPAVYLACLFVMMKHVSGIDQFLIGITQSLNNSNNFLTIGLVSETVPVKANMNGSALSFTDLVESIMQTLEKMASVAPRASFGEFAAKLGLAFDFPLRFAFYQQQQTEMWKEAGLSVAADLLEVDSEKGSRLWSVNGLSTYDAKLIIVEDLGVVRCVFKFRKDRLQRETVERWVSKYQTTLDGLNSSAKKTLTVGRLISRYYNT